MSVAGPLLSAVWSHGPRYSAVRCSAVVASSAPRIPVSTSPDPAVASAAGPGGGATTLPSGRATIVRRPLRAMTPSNACAALTAWVTGSASTSARVGTPVVRRPRRSTSSPACGVTMHVVSSGRVRSPRPPASMTRGRDRFSASMMARRMRRVSGAPGPTAHAWTRPGSVTTSGQRSSTAAVTSSGASRRSMPSPVDTAAAVVSSPAPG